VIDALQKALPLVTVLALVAALTYVGGFMHYAGVQWVGMFDIGDIFAVSWPIVSSATIFLLAGFAFAFADRASNASDRVTGRPEVKVKPVSRLWLIVLIAAPLLGSRLVMRLPVEFGVFAIVAPIVCGVLYEIVRRRLGSVQNFAVLSVLTLSFCFCAGIAMGSLPFSEEKTTLARLTNGNQVCGRLVTPLRKGALIAVSRSSVIFMEWSRIESLQTDANCGATDA